MTKRKYQVNIQAFLSNISGGFTFRPIGIDVESDRTPDRAKLAYIEAEKKLRKSFFAFLDTLTTDPKAKMDRRRREELENDVTTELTEEEMRAGWHFCIELDGLLTQGEPVDGQCICGFDKTKH